MNNLKGIYGLLISPQYLYCIKGRCTLVGTNQEQDTAGFEVPIRGLRYQIVNHTYYQVATTCS